MADFGHKIKVLHVHYMLVKLRENIVISLIISCVDKIYFFIFMYNVIHCTHVAVYLWL